MFETLFLSFLPILILVPLLVFEVSMLIHAIRNKKLDGNARILWVAGIIIFNFIASVLYYFMHYDGPYGPKKT